MEEGGGAIGEPPQFRLHHRAEAARRAGRDVVQRIIEARRHSPEDRGDLLSMLIAARDEETGQGMDDRQLYDEVMAHRRP